MDINDLRSLVTVLGFGCFIAICVWAYSRSARASFDEAARLPFTDDDAPVRSAARHSKEG